MTTLCIDSHPPPRGAGWIRHSKQFETSTLESWRLVGAKRVLVLSATEGGQQLWRGLSPVPPGRRSLRWRPWCCATKGPRPNEPFWIGGLPRPGRFETVVGCVQARDLDADHVGGAARPHARAAGRGGVVRPTRKRSAELARRTGKCQRPDATAKASAAHAASVDKTLNVCDSLHHEIFNESEQDKGVGDVVTWIEGHV
jgi:hypothetical protein